MGRKNSRKKRLESLEDNMRDVYVTVPPQEGKYTLEEWALQDGLRRNGRIEIPSIGVRLVNKDYNSNKDNSDYRN